MEESTGSTLACGGASSAGVLGDPSLPMLAEFLFLFLLSVLALLLQAPLAKGGGRVAAAPSCV